MRNIEINGKECIQLACCTSYDVAVVAVVAVLAVLAVLTVLTVIGEAVLVCVTPVLLPVLAVFVDGCVVTANKNNH